jgi:hypothetical protein
MEFANLSEFERIMQEMADDVDRFGSCLAETELTYRMWIIGHNFDIIGALATQDAAMQTKWQEGFNAGRVIQGFCEGAGPVHISQDSAD